MIELVLDDFTFIKIEVLNRIQLLKCEIDWVNSWIYIIIFDIASHSSQSNGVLFDIFINITLTLTND